MSSIESRFSSCRTGPDRGDHIEYWDDSGFTASGDFIESMLHHAGKVMRRQV